MPDNEDVRAMQSIRLGKLAANAPHDQAKKLVSTQEKKKSLVPAVESVIQKENARQALGSFKRGGKVKKTGLYKLHKNEKVVPAKRATKRA